MLFRLRTLFAALCCTLPTLVMANGCIDTPNRIYHDVKKYESTLGQRNFTWENMSWLQVQLGSPKVRKLDNNQIEYTWLCANDADATLQIITDAAGRFMYVKGQYNLDTGSGAFEAAINQQNAPVKTIVTTIKTVRPVKAKIRPLTSAEMAALTAAQAPSPAMKSTPFPAATTGSNPAICQNLVQQINDDIKKYNLTTNKQRTDLPWMDLGWLQLKLGPTSSTEATETLYTWNNYQLLQRATAMPQSYGTYSGNKLPNNLQEAMQVMGKPNSTQEENFTKYVWRCTSENSSLLEVYADKDNQLAYVTGNSCQGLCADFSVQLQPALSAGITLPEIKTNSGAQTAQLDQASLNTYNQYFHTQFTDAKQMQLDMVQRMKNYYLNLRNCTVGQYPLAVNIGGNPVFAAANIKGKQNGLCMIQEGTQIGTQRIMKLCNYEARTLTFFTDPEAEAIATETQLFPVKIWLNYNARN